MMAFILLYIGIGLCVAYGEYQFNRKHYWKYSEIYDELGADPRLWDGVFSILVGIYWPVIMIDEYLRKDIYEGWEK